MKKLFFFKTISLIVLIFLINNCIGQQTDWNKIYLQAQNVTASLPTIAKINNSKLPFETKQLLLNTIATLNMITTHKTEPSKELIVQINTSLKSLAKDLENDSVLAETKSGGGTGGGSAIGCGADALKACLAACPSGPRVLGGPDPGYECGLSCYAGQIGCASSAISSAIKKYSTSSATSNKTANNK